MLLFGAHIITTLKSANCSIFADAKLDIREPQYNKTALEYAIDENKNEIAKMLIEAGATKPVNFCEKVRRNRY